MDADGVEAGGFVGKLAVTVCWHAADRPSVQGSKTPAQARLGLLQGAQRALRRCSPITRCRLRPKMHLPTTISVPSSGCGLLVRPAASRPPVTCGPGVLPACSVHRHGTRYHRLPGPPPQVRAGGPGGQKDPCSLVASSHSRIHDETPALPRAGWQGKAVGQGITGFMIGIGHVAHRSWSGTRSQQPPPVELLCPHSPAALCFRIHAATR
jgi:hypothetical protein